MAKKKDKTKSRAEQVRTAVDQAFSVTADGAQQAQQLTRDRAQELADDLSSVANRFREAIEELRPPSIDELKQLTDRVAALEQRVAELSSAPAAKEAARKPAARKPAARKPAARKPAPKTPAIGPSAEAKPAPKPAPAKAPAARKPATPRKSTPSTPRRTSPRTSPGDGSGTS